MPSGVWLAAAVVLQRIILNQWALQTQSIKRLPCNRPQTPCTPTHSVFNTPKSSNTCILGHTI